MKTTSRSCSPNVMPTLELVNEEMVNDSGHESFSGVNRVRVSVNGLTASWTHVSLIDYNFQQQYTMNSTSS